ncbi:hypothetical protein ACFFWC_28265 [Plantactinospora siamensis]|uniref:Uncharacterized protein n=1 Tax=Plantactinospora siamensis TaxID=555372 RepID=A0ABV6NQ07_9ACTN
MTTVAPPTLLLPIGQFFGTFHPVVGSAERYHRVRLRDEVWELEDPRFLVWALLHGVVGPLAERPWTFETLREAAAEHLGPEHDLAALLADLDGAGLAARVAPGSDEAIGFARRHRIGARMLGLGNSADEPWLYAIGFFDHPVIKVTRTVYDLWERCPSGESLWDLCAALAAEERQAGGTEPDLIDPEVMLAGFLTTVHSLLVSSALYLEPMP